MSSKPTPRMEPPRWKMLFFLAILFVNIVTITSKKGSLTFVIDDTPSMRLEIESVKGITESLYRIMRTSSSQIQDVVLVTFNDPVTINPAFLLRYKSDSKDETNFLNALRKVYAHGGSDCPEPSMTGMQLGLTESRQNSLFYVFTDASPKDVHLKHKVITQAQAISTQITFFITQSADCREKFELYLPYYEIAAATYGQVFWIPDKNTIPKLLETIGDAISGEHTVLESKQIPSNKREKIPFTIDDQTEFVIVSASGRNVYLEVNGPDLSNMDRKIWESDAKIIKIRNPVPGSYEANVEGNSVTTIKIYGRTDFNFQHGFSESVPPTFRIDKKQPTEGIKHHLLINVSDPAQSVDIKRADILSMDDKILYSLPLELVSEDYFKTELFMPPSTMFKIRVVGVGKKTRKTITRSAKTPIEPRLRELDPKIEIEGSATYEYNSCIKLICKVKAHPKPNVIWKDANDNEVRGTNTRAVRLYDYISELEINNVKKSSVYYCSAWNDRGQNSERADVTILSPFVVDDKPTSDIHVEYSDSALINCNIKSNEEFKISWFIMKNNKFENLQNLQGYTVVNDGKQLKIDKVTENFERKYACKAWLPSDSHTTQVLEKNVIINHLAPIMEENTKKNIRENENTNIRCPIIKAYPKPKIIWQHKALNSGAFKKISEATDTITIQHANLESSGVYKCIAENDRGKNEHKTELVVSIKPKVKILVNNEERSPVYVNYNSEVSLMCNVTSIETPMILWKDEKGNELTHKVITRHFSHVSHLIVPRIKQSETYFCIASNIIGENKESVQIHVRDPLQIDTIEGTVEAKYLEEVTLKCGIESKFPLTITWMRHNKPITDSNDYIIAQNGNELKIKRLDLDLQGKYVCKAHIKDDMRWQAIHGTEVKIVGLEKPEIEKTNRLIETFRNENVALRCNIFKGHPKPKVNWLFKNEKNREFLKMNVTGKDLVINKANDDHSGQYKCIVSNILGHDEHTVQLIVKGPPIILSDEDEIYRGVEGDTELRIPCTVIGHPKPTLVWSTSDGIIVPGQSGEIIEIKLFVDLEEIDNKYAVKDGVLIINQPKDQDSKNYTCTAKNSLGTAKKSFEGHVTKYLPDEELSAPKYIYILEGETKQLNCSSKDVKGRWFKQWVALNLTGNLTIKNAEKSNDGNYTCRIKDKSGYKTTTYVVNVGFPPKLSGNVDFQDMDWIGNNADLWCSAELKPDIETAKVEWTYNGKPSNLAKGQPKETIHPIIGWGTYTCKISNYHGNVTKTYKIYSKDCLMHPANEIKKSPLVLGYEEIPPPLLWTGNQYRIRNGQSLILSCPISKNGNHFELIPKKTEINAICDHEDIYTVDGKAYKFDDLQCKAEVLPDIERTHEKCGFEKSELIKVGYKVGQHKKIIEVYSVCFDNQNQRPIYAKTNLSTDNEVPILASWHKYDDFGKIIDNKCDEKSKCCLGSVQLVNQLDVKHGPMQTATFIEGLNSVPFWHNCNNSSDVWNAIEKAARKKFKRFANTLTLSGASGYSEKNGIVIPRYLWKVWRTKRSFIPTIIAQINDPEPTKADILCQHQCGNWVPKNNFNTTFCCSLSELRQTFPSLLDHLLTL